MKIFVLEDDSYRINFFLEKFCDYDITITENAYSAIDYLKEETFGYLFLDHDLGEGNGSGQDVVDYLSKNPSNKNNLANIIVHSWNVPAAEKMVSLLPPQTTHIPFNTMVISEINPWQIGIDGYIIIDKK